MGYGCDYGIAEGPCGGRTYGGNVRQRSAFAGREGEHDVAVKHGVGGSDGHREAVVGHLGDLVGLLLGERGVSGDDSEGGVAEGRHLGWGCGGVFQDVEAIKETEAIGVTGPGDNLSGLRIDDAAEGVDGDQGPDGVAAHLSAGAAEAALHRTLLPEGFAHCCTCPCTNGALERGRGVGGEAGLVAVLGAGANGGVSDGEVEEDGRGNDGNNAHPYGKAYALLFKVDHHTVGRGEAVCAATAEDDGVGLLDKVERSEEVGLTGAGCRTPDVDTSNCALGGEDDGTAGNGLGVGVVADSDAWYVGYRVVQQNPRKPTARVHRGLFCTRSGSPGYRPLGYRRFSGKCLPPLAVGCEADCTG